MIGSLSGGEGLGQVSSSYFVQQTQRVKTFSASGGLSGGEGGGGVSQSPLSISGPGQLLSDLQQLQKQDPAKFKDVVSEITSQLQAAAQQTQGPKSDFLANLANKFENVANGGSLSQLYPQQQHQHHNNPALQAYGQNSQDQSQGVAGLAPPSGSPTSSSGSSLQQLFANISSEVSQALDGIPKT